MKKAFVLMAVLGLLAAGPLGGSAFAFTAQTGTFTSFPAFGNSFNGDTYFNNQSSDPANTRANLGYFLLGNTQPSGSAYNGPSGGISPNIALADAQYLSDGAATPGAENNMYFKDGTGDALKLLAAAGLASGTSFGYYAVDSLGVRTDAINHTVFSNGSSVGGSPTNVNLPTYFGLFLDVNGTIYYSQDSLDASDNGYQHFALVINKNDPTTWYLGMEDMPVGPNGTGDRDYNDMVVALSPLPPSGVPIPPSVLLLGSGLLGLGALGWRRQQG